MQNSVDYQTLILQDGKLMHEDMEKIWPPGKFPPKLYNWLLRLTEEFNLTFPSKSGPFNIVPCLLKDMKRM